MKKQLLTLMIVGTAISANCQQWWQQQSNSQNDFRTIYAANPSTIYCYGDSSDIWGGFAYGSQFKTVNQGFDWNFLSMGSPVYRADGSFFVNSSMGFLAGENMLSGNGFILRTTNAGVTWTEGAPFPERFRDIRFADVMTGYACGRNDYVVRTNDNGASWVDVSPNTGDHLEGVFFTTPSNGYVVGRGGVMAYTSDSANTWTNLNSGTGQDLLGVWFINDSTGWVCGKSGKMLYTNDYGANWTTQTSNTPEDLYDVEFVNDSTGWAVGTAGTVIKTTDGGQNWNNENSGTPEDIWSITMINEQLGWFCGKNGTIHIYSVAQPNSVSNNDDILNVKVYPNPTSSTASVMLPDDKAYSFVLTNIQGDIVRVWKTSGVNIVDVECEDLNQGIYFLQIQNENKVTSIQKLVINK